jgi:hypothetical protein
MLRRRQDCKAMGVLKQRVESTEYRGQIIFETFQKSGIGTRSRTPSGLNEV